MATGIVQRVVCTLTCTKTDATGCRGNFEHYTGQHLPGSEAGLNSHELETPWPLQLMHRVRPLDWQTLQGVAGGASLKHPPTYTSVGMAGCGTMLAFEMESDVLD